VSGEITAEVTYECRITATNKRHKYIVQPRHYTHVAVMCGRPDLTFNVRLTHRSESFALWQQPYLEGVTNTWLLVMTYIRDFTVQAQCRPDQCSRIIVWNHIRHASCDVTTGIGPVSVKV